MLCNLLLLWLPWENQPVLFPVIGSIFNKVCCFISLARKYQHQQYKQRWLMQFALMQLFFNGSQECEAGCCEVVQRYCPDCAAGVPVDREGHKDSWRYGWEVLFEKSQLLKQGGHISAFQSSIKNTPLISKKTRD